MTEPEIRVITSVTDFAAACESPVGIITVEAPEGLDVEIVKTYGATGEADMYLRYYYEAFEDWGLAFNAGASISPDPVVLHWALANLTGSAEGDPADVILTDTMRFHHLTDLELDGVLQFTGRPLLQEAALRHPDCPAYLVELVRQDCEDDTADSSRWRNYFSLEAWEYLLEVIADIPYEMTKEQLLEWLPSGHDLQQRGALAYMMRVYGEPTNWPEEHRAIAMQLVIEGKLEGNAWELLASLVPDESSS